MDRETIDCECGAKRYKSICPNCNKQRWSHRKDIDTRCRLCWYKHISKFDPVKFWERVKKTETCWIWNTNDKGKKPWNYGRYSYNGKKQPAHRISWLLTYGKWPAKFICHKCDNPPCVRPDHLFEGTPKDNTQDCIKKGRFPFTPKHMQFQKGLLPKNRKLIFEQAQEIRRKHIPHTVGKNTLAKEYGVSPSIIQSILSNKSYLH